VPYIDELTKFVPKSGDFNTVCYSHLPDHLRSDLYCKETLQAKQQELLQNEEFVRFTKS